MRHGRELIVNGEIILSGEVLSDTWAGWMWEEDVYFSPRMVREALAELAGDPSAGPVTVRMSSYGGHVEAGEAIRAIIAAHPGGVRMIVEGVAMSAASLILMGAAERLMSEGSLLMIHDPRGGAWGTQEDLRHEADVLETISAVAAAVYARVSGLPVAEIRDIMAAETFYAPEAALEAGFITGIAGPEAAPVEMAGRSARVLRGLARPASHEAARAGFDAARARVGARVAARARQDRANRGAPGSRSSAASGGVPARTATREETVMEHDDQAADTATPTPAPAAGQAAPAPDPNAAVMAERGRVQRIQEMANPFIASGRLTQAEVSEMIAGGHAPEVAAGRLMALMAAQEPPLARGPAARVLRDEAETRSAAMEDALVARLSRSEPSEAGRAYMQHSIVDMAAERIEARRVPGSFGAREQILMTAFHSTTDFPALFENALNRALAARYRSAEPTYRRIARRRTYVDFRDHSTVRVGDFPELREVNPDGGELESGTFSEAKERTRVKAFGVMVHISRAMMVNDSLDGIQQVLSDRGRSVARFEDKVFYAMMLGGSNADGPTLLETTRQVFNTTDGTKAGTAAAISIASLSLGRAAIRKRKSLDGSDLELSASILLVGSDKQTEAEQIVAPITPALAGSVNPFSGQLEVVTTAKIAGNAWYLFASPEDAACFEWGLLEGYDAPRFRIEDVFGRQGTSLSLEHDFGCGAIDWRGGYKNAGA